jgi:hypothetical protein
MQTKKRKVEHEADHEEENDGIWKYNLTTLQQMKPGRYGQMYTNDTNEIPQIGSIFEFLNRDELLDQLYRYFEVRYNNFHVKYTSDIPRSLAFTVPYCFSGPGMGKTTIWNRGIERIFF